MKNKHYIVLLGLSLMLLLAACGSGAPVSEPPASISDASTGSESPASSDVSSSDVSSSGDPESEEADPESAPGSVPAGDASSETDSAVQSQPEQEMQSQPEPAVVSPIMVDWPGEYGPHIEQAPADLGDLGAVTRIYLKPMLPGSDIFGRSWASGNEVSADMLICFYAHNNFAGLPIWMGADGYTYNIGEGAPVLPGAEIEETLQKHFDVSVEHLRTSSQYNVDSQTYVLYDYFSSPYEYVAQSVEERDDGLYIAFGARMYGQEEVRVLGVLSLRIEQDNVVKYLAFAKTQ